MPAGSIPAPANPSASPAAIAAAYSAGEAAVSSGRIARPGGSPGYEYPPPRSISSGSQPPSARCSSPTSPPIRRAWSRNGSGSAVCRPGARARPPAPGRRGRARAAPPAAPARDPRLVGVGHRSQRVVLRELAGRLRRRSCPGRRRMRTRAVAPAARAAAAAAASSSTLSTVRRAPTSIPARSGRPAWSTR